MESVQDSFNVIFSFKKGIDINGKNGVSGK